MTRVRIRDNGPRIKSPALDEENGRCHLVHLYARRMDLCTCLVRKIVTSGNDADVCRCVQMCADVCRCVYPAVNRNAIIIFFSSP